MNVLDSPLEALAFNYVSLGFFTFVNNLWTWIAVITAAVSFWKIRAVGAAGGVYSVDSPPPRNDRSSNRPSAPPKSEEPPPPPAETTLALASASGHVEDDGPTKRRKFTLYYEDNGELTESDGDEMVAVEECCGGEEWWEGYWERALKTRLGETSWYRYQDLTELNGNVVRLWDGCRSNRENAVMLSSSKRCVSW
ncbi:Transmembrane protein [Trema orientale]|uniref:Transmembrane protein n=1 Tax=Trema orientale TaxID=63057 RepID=A0A2P5AQ29_TREOI|nr:Transmembrane protein [Trema orientale]